MTHDDPAGATGTAMEPEIVDPSDKHFERSSTAFAVYDDEVENNETSVAYLVEPNYEQFGRGGNEGSRQGFDFDSFRDCG